MDNDNSRTEIIRDEEKDHSAKVLDLPQDRLQSFKKPATSTVLAAKPVPSANPAQVTFSRIELSEILKVYGRRVAAGEWRDYAMDFEKERAVFSIFKRTSEMPVYRIEKNPKLQRKQGAFSVIAASGMVLKRGHELAQVLKVFETKRHLRVVD
ncbi:MAG: DUF2794 domain-containing protein [Pseudomonadota bacterium]